MIHVDFIFMSLVLVLVKLLLHIRLLCAWFIKRIYIEKKRF